MLEQATASAIDRVVGTYGQEFVAILGKIAYQPAFGSKQQLQTLAMQCLQNYQERQKQNAK